MNAIAGFYASKRNLPFFAHASFDFLKLLLYQIDFSVLVVIVKKYSTS